LIKDGLYYNRTWEPTQGRIGEGRTGYILVALTDQEKNEKARRDAEAKILRKVRIALGNGKREEAKKLLEKIGFNAWDIELLIMRPGLIEKLYFAEYIGYMRKEYIKWLFS